MREGDDVRDIYWRKSVNQLVIRERAQEAEQDVNLLLDNQRPPATSDKDWTAVFESRIRDLASRAVAHIKRGDRVTVRTATGEVVRVDRAVGADPLLRFLALLEPQPGRISRADDLLEEQKSEPLATVSEASA
jgi:uncharacterized protein (DUF58 family)